MPANVDTMMYTGEKPWHGLGTELQHPATAAEAILAAGLNWEAVKGPAKTEYEGEDILIKDTFHIIRKDKKAVLGTVGNKYKIVQNAEAFSFFDNVVGQDQAIYHTAGALGIGEKIWILAKLPDVLRIGNNRNDIIEKFLLLVNSHDGRGSIRMFFTPIRVVCQNTLNIALQNTDQGISIRHVGNIEQKIKTAQQALGFAVKYYQDFEERAKYLATVNLTSVQVDTFLNDCFKEFNLESQRGKNMIISVKEMFENERNSLPSIKGTAWALFNAAVEYVDYSRTTKGKDDLNRKSNRLQSIWIGSGAALKQNTWNRINTYVDAI